MSIKFRGPHPYIPFLRVAVDLCPRVTYLGHPLLLRISLHSPNDRAALLRVFRRRGELLPTVEWSWTDHVVACVADAIDAYRLTQNDDGADEPEPDGWRDVAEVTLDEWLACPWWEWRYSATASPWRQSSRETQSVPALGQVRRVPTQGDESDGWCDVATITPEEWAAWRWWLWRHEARASVTIQCTGQNPRPGHGSARRLRVLEWPEMGGVWWTDARQVTQAMIDAWPVWEVDRGDFIAAVPGAGVTVSGALAGQWRPLRLPGMSTDLETLGEIAGEDMRPEHFKRVRNIDAWRVRAGGDPWTEPSAELCRFPMVRKYTWRPAVFGDTPATWKNGGFTPSR